MQTTTATVQPPPTPKLILGETYGFWCQTLVLLAAAVFGALAIRSARATERRKAAIGAVFASHHDMRLNEALHLIAILHKDDKKIAVWGREEHRDTDQAKAIRYALNHYEYVAVAIFQGIYDETLYKHARYSTVVQLYERTKSFIHERRGADGPKTAWQELERLAVRWQANPLKVTAIKAVEVRNWLKRLFGH